MGSWSDRGFTYSKFNNLLSDGINVGSKPNAEAAINRAAQMTILNVELEDHHSTTQVSEIMDLLRLIREVAEVTGDESYQLTALNTPEPRGSLVPSRPKQEIDFDNINPVQKRHIISQAIAWGSRNGKITLKILEKLSPEEMLNLATKFLSDMTDREKDIIFRETT